MSDNAGGGGVSNDAAAALWGKKSLKERFGSLSGRELQEKLFGLYQVSWPAFMFKLFTVTILLHFSCVEHGGSKVCEARTVAWFAGPGGADRNIERRPINNRKQTSVKKQYARNILQHGIMEGCRSQPWLVEYLGRLLP